MTLKPTWDDVIAWWKEEKSGREAAEARVQTLEAALARAEGNLTTAGILIGNLLSDGDDDAASPADRSAARAFLDVLVAGRSRGAGDGGVDDKEAEASIGNSIQARSRLSP